MPKQWKDAIEVSVEAIRENDWNPNEVDSAMFQQLVENIRRAGFNQPLVVRPYDGDEEPFEYEVVDGAHRFRAAKQVGMVKVPVIVRPFTTAEAKTQTVAMNKLRGEMDPARVAQLIREVESDGIDLAELARFTGYSHDELTRTVSLEDFDWQQYAGSGEPTRERASGGGQDDAWVTLAYRVPAEVARMFAEQVGRIRRLAGDIPDHMAVEALVAVAMASPDEDFTA